MAEGTVLGAVEADLQALGEPWKACGLAATARDLAGRLDGEPADTAAVLLARELRQTLAELRTLAGGDHTNDVESFLERISAPDRRHTAD